jgi:N-dimethylarginine dimethylaminohydrolase
MKPFEKFLIHSSLFRELLDNYLEMRTHLQEEGFTQEQLERVTRPTNKMMELRERFISKKNALFKQIKDYGFEIHQGELTEYIQPLLNKIDEITPLKEYGDNERDNIGNDDY